MDLRLGQISWLQKKTFRNYIHPTVLQRLVPGTTITYADFDHAKNLCKNYPDSALRAYLGGSKVAEKHYCSLTYADLRLTWFDGNNDEFLDLYNLIVSKLN